MASLETVRQRRNSEILTNELIQNSLKQYAPSTPLVNRDWLGIGNAVFLREFNQLPDQQMGKPPTELTSRALSEDYQLEYDEILLRSKTDSFTTAHKVFELFNIKNISLLIERAKDAAKRKSFSESEACLQLAQEQIIWGQDMERWLENETVRPLLQLGNPFNGREAKKVQFPESLDDLHVLAEDMRTMNEKIVEFYTSSNKPSFLHAAQVGFDMDVISMRSQPIKDGPIKYIFIVNPELHWVREEKEISAEDVEKQAAYEGCYGYFEGRPLVPRPMPDEGIRLVVNGSNIDGTPIELSYGPEDEQTARLIQHEYDHGRGINVVDRVINPDHDIENDLLAYYQNKYRGQEHAEDEANKSAAKAYALVFFLKRVKGDKEGVYYIPGPGGEPLELRVDPTKLHDKDQIIRIIQEKLIEKAN